MPATKVIVNIPGERPYDVRIGADVLDGLGNYLRRVEATANAPRILVPRCISRRRRRRFERRTIA